MWLTIHKVKADRPESIEMTQDLLETTSRKIMIVTTAICGAFILPLGMIRAGALSLGLVPVILLLTLVFAVSLILVSHRLVLAQVIWLLGIISVITLGLVSTKTVEIAFLYTLIPLMAVALIGWLAGIGFGLLEFAVIAGVNLILGGTIIPAYYFWLIAFAQILFGFIGWAIVSPLLTMVEWTNFSYRMARDNLEELRDQRLGFNQVQEDLILANKELVRLTSSLKVMTERAEEARRVKEEFVANVSHELRTPLNMIIGYTNLIINSPQAYGKQIPTRLLADITSIQRNSQHLVDLINDVLDLSQLDAGRLAFTRQWTSVREIITSAVMAVQPLFISKKLYLDTDLPDDELKVFCDETRVREVILNLLSNAGRFTDQGGVVVRAQLENSSLLVSINDTGPGIPVEDQQRIFEPFQQLAPLLHHRTGGSGLGLSISKRFVEMHDGRMWLESEIGRGTTFHFRIPIAPAASGGEVSGASRWVNPYMDRLYEVRGRPFKAPRPEFTPRFVIVEQGESLAHLFTRYMDQVEFTSFSSIPDALVSIEASPAQAVIVNDRDLKTAAYLDTLATFDTPVINCWIPGRDEPARRLGVVDYLIKPIDQEHLIRALDEIGGQDMTLLMVDDDAETLQLFGRIISVSRPGIRVIRAANGSEAMQLMRERMPDLVLLDLFLPEMDGFKVLQEKEIDPAISAIPVIVISSNDPAGVPIISNQFSVRRATGLSVKEFLDCLMAIIETLNAAPRKSHPGHLETAPG
ncbi:MAG: hybrid sensor histidine kinase/response regulator [Anaerolineaceae bacterium]|nr:hybrid sensor histidine kinase/response regulator [Anaerolineaceae bacterium]